MSGADRRILQRVDRVCAEIQTTRAEVLCALVRALVGEPQSNQMPGVPHLSAQDCILRELHRSGSLTVRELKTRTTYRRHGIVAFDRALNELCVAGRLRVAEELTGSGHMRRVVILLREPD